MEIQDVPQANRDAVNATRGLNAKSKGGGISDEPLCWFLVYQEMNDGGAIVHSEVLSYHDHRNIDTPVFWLVVAALHDGFDVEEPICEIDPKKLGGIVSALAWAEFLPDFDPDEPDNYRSYKQLRDAAKAVARGDKMRLSLGWVEKLPPEGGWEMKVLPMMAETARLVSNER